MRLFRYLIHVYSPREQNFYANIKLLLFPLFFVKFHQDTQNNIGIGGQKHFLYTDKYHNFVINNGNLPINNPCETFLIQIHMHNLNEIH